MTFFFCNCCSVVFAGFSAESLRARIEDGKKKVNLRCPDLISWVFIWTRNYIFTASACVVVTSDEGVRGGKVIPLKETVDNAVRGLDYIRRVYVAHRTGAKVNMQSGRDLQLQDVR